MNESLERMELPLLVPAGEEKDGLEPLDFGMDTPRFCAGDKDPQRFKVRYFRRSSDGALIGQVWLGPLCQGPPKHAHGGALATLMDEAMGFAAWANGRMVVAAEITVRFKAPAPLETPLQIVARMTQIDGRRISTEGRIEGLDGRSYTTATGLFVELPAEKFRALAEARE